MTTMEPQAEAAYRQALALHGQSRLEEARILYQQALQLQPKHFQSLNLLAVIALQTNHPQDAIVLIEIADAYFDRAIAELIGHLPGKYRYVSVQKAIRVSDARTLEANPRIGNFAADLNDFSDTAALCECLDLDRDDSPWYPTVKLFRQKRFGDWGGVFEQIRLELLEAFDPN
ncbi:MAG: tetratricopeptide repeat protein [Steroidobacteraceae bacterium]